MCGHYITEIYEGRYTAHFGKIKHSVYCTALVRPGYYDQLFNGAVFTGERNRLKGKAFTFSCYLLKICRTVTSQFIQ